MAQTVASRTQFDPAKAVRSAVHHLPRYSRPVPPESQPERNIRLDWNESPYGPSPSAIRAVQDALAHNRYPEFDAWSLREALAMYAGTNPEQLIAGAGLDNVIETLFALLLEPGDGIIISQPTFMVYELLAQAHGANVINVPLHADFNLDVDGILDAVDNFTKLIIICNPNNPTGNLLDERDIESIVRNAPCVVAIDEAYAEFAGSSMLHLMVEAPNIVILRTLSKFAGLAGMRVGYGVFPPSLVEYVGRIMPGFCNVSVAATAAAIAAVKDVEYNRETVSRIVADRETLAAQLREIPGVKPLPSATNFLLVRLPVADAGPVVRKLAQNGVFVRHFSSPTFGIADCLRVSIGTTEEHEIFLHELEAALHEAHAQP